MLLEDLGTLLSHHRGCVERFEILQALSLVWLDAIPREGSEREGGNEWPRNVTGVEQIEGIFTMALSNFLVTVVGVGAIVLMLRGDVRKSSVTLRRNLRHIREWLETEQGAASNKGEHVKPKEMGTGSLPSENPPTKGEKVQ